MDKFYTKYTNWECWKNGMYRDVSKSEKDYLISKSIEVLKDPEKHMNRVINEWIYSCKEFLSDTKSNRKSWLGQASCCIAYGSTESCTRIAWGMLTDKEREKANNIAKKIIEKWEKFY